MDMRTAGRFDFEYWRRLADEDPEGFERARERAIAELIEAAPTLHQRRMQGLQWRIDREREQAPNAMAACFRISNMMWESLLGRGGLLETLHRLEGVDPHKGQPRRPARVIPLRSPPARAKQTDA